MVALRWPRAGQGIPRVGETCHNKGRGTRRPPRMSHQGAVMSERIDDKQSSLRAFNAMLALQQQVDGVELEPLLLELVTTRASQINGCAFCLDMHTRDAMARGESAQRLHLLPAWRETTVYSARECAALAWTEALTLVAPEPRAAGGLRRGAAHVSAARAGRSVAGDRRHQRLESIVGGVSHAGAGSLSHTARRRGRCVRLRAVFRGRASAAHSRSCARGPRADRRSDRPARSRRAAAPRSSRAPRW